MKGGNYILFMLLFLLSDSVISQCPQFGVRLRTQTDVDQFITQYPNCEFLKGSLRIGNSFWENGPVDITDISGLASLKSISSDLDIIDCDSLLFIDAFHSLDSIGGTLNIARNQKLKKIDDFQSLQYIGKDVDIYLNDSLKEITKFQNVTTVGDRIEISFNRFLERFDGFSQVASLEGGLYLQGCPLLTEINGLHNLEYTKGANGVSISDLGISNLSFLSRLKSISGQYGALLVRDCPNLNDVNGLSKLENVEGFLNFENCEKVSSLAALSSLVDVGSILVYNTGVTNLVGFENCFAGRRGRLSVKKNSFLTSLHGLNTWNNFQGSIEIENNPLLADIRALTGIDTIRSGSSFQALTIKATAVTNLDNFQSLKYLEGHLSIATNPALTNLDGLHSLNYVDGRVDIAYNPLLNDCYGICPLLSTGTVTNSVAISNNLSACNTISEITTNGCSSECSNLIQSDYSFSIVYPECSVAVYAKSLLDPNAVNCAEGLYSFVDGTFIKDSLVFSCADTGTHDIKLVYADDTLNTTISILNDNNYCVQDSIIKKGSIQTNEILIASNYIVSNSHIVAPSDVIFKSAEAIVLLDSFQVEHSATFKGVINQEVCH